MSETLKIKTESIKKVSSGGGKMRSKQQTRHKLILDLLSDRKEHGIDEIAARIGASPATLRRDLGYLDEQELLVRTHGGARYKQKMSFRPSYADRMHLNQVEKHAIARAAVQLIRNHDTIALCNGTTTFYLAQEIIRSGLEVTVITNAIDSVIELATCPKVRTILLGGEVTEGYTLAGSWGESMLRRISTVDKTFLGADGLSLTHGFTAYYPSDAALHARMAEVAREIVALVDHDKFGIVKLSPMLALDQVHLTVTDNGLHSSVADEYRSHGLRLQIAAAEE